MTRPSVWVGDIADIEDTFEEPSVIARIDGVPAITFQVKKKHRADVIRIVDLVKGKIAELSHGLPEEVSIKYRNDQSFYIERRFSVVLHNGAIHVLTRIPHEGSAAVANLLTSAGSFVPSLRAS
ncbi:MAG: hypothetical protein GF355_08405 [Candidatus Eisenbacteria bacterium]|nr:hypothetical protein [Candidatus Eisenbacteria bacterium]